MNRKDGHLNPEDMPEGVLSKTYTKLPMKEIKPFRLSDMLDMVKCE